MIFKKHLRAKKKVKAACPGTAGGADALQGDDGDAAGAAAGGESGGMLLLSG
jgi:hypothetical protein